MRRYNLVIIDHGGRALRFDAFLSGIRYEKRPDTARPHHGVLRLARFAVGPNGEVPACRREDLYTGQFLRFGRFIETSDTLGSADSVVSPRFVRRLREA